jgi:hypothetical protein
MSKKAQANAYKPLAAAIDANTINAMYPILHINCK